MALMNIRNTMLHTSIPLVHASLYDSWEGRCLSLAEACATTRACSKHVSSRERVRHARVRHRWQGERDTS
jgi:hypothetical protein